MSPSTAPAAVQAGSTDALFAVDPGLTPAIFQPQSPAFTLQEPQAPVNRDPQAPNRVQSPILAKPVQFDLGDMIITQTEQTDRALTTRSGSFEATTVEEFNRTLRSEEFNTELDRLRDQVRKDFNLERTLAVSTTGATIGATLLYLLWIIRSGVLLTSYLSAMPAWRTLDPLPVLAHMDGPGGGDGADGEDGGPDDDDPSADNPRERSGDGFGNFA